MTHKHYPNDYQIMNRIRFILLLLLLPLLAGATSIFDQLQRTEEFTATEVTLTVPVDSLLAKVATEQEAGIVFTDEQGVLHTYDLEVSVRGKFRRNRCSFVPLKLNFSKKDLKAAGLESFDKYKLVVPCFEGGAATDLIIKEYLAYRAYNLLTPASFRVQLLNLTYRDAAGDHADRTVTAFLIENTKEMAVRLGGEEVDEALGLAAAAYDAKAEISHALFQYLLGNGDWSLPLARNAKFVRMPEGQIVPVGYDFDFSGWVGAPYASPSSEIGQTSLYERVYLGYHQSDTLMRAVAGEFRGQRKAIISLINRSPLPELEREQLWRFTARFFAQVNRMANNGQLLFYDQLRGETAAIIPPGAEAESYRSTGK